MILQQKIRIEGEDREKALTEDSIKCIYVTYVDDTAEMPLVRLEMGEFKRVDCKSFAKMMQQAVESCEVTKEVDYTYFDVTSESHYAALQIAVRNRRGKANNVLVSQKTFKLLGEETIQWFKDMNFVVTICKGIPNDHILIAYVGGPFDRSFHSYKKGLTWKYTFAPETLKANCTVLKILK